MPIDNTTVYKNQITFADNMDNCWCYDADNPQRQIYMYMNGLKDYLTVK